MTLEAKKEDFTIPTDTPGFFRLVVDQFKKTETVRNIETIAERLVKKEGMEKFIPQVESKEELRGKLKEFLGEKEWKKITEEEGNRWLTGDRDIVSASGG